MEDLLGGFISKKKAESSFLSLGDGESAVIIKINDLKLVTKTGYDGKEKEVLRLKCVVQTSEGPRDKDFDVNTARLAAELKEKGVGKGFGFTLSRTGSKNDTKYTVSNVTKPE